MMGLFESDWDKIDHEIWSSELNWLEEAGRKKKVWGAKDTNVFVKMPGLI